MNTPSTKVNAFLLDERNKEHEVKVVGESNYQEALRSIADARGRDDLGPDEDYNRGEWRHVVVALIPEPSNAYDPNAIVVQIQSKRGPLIAGYLSRADAIAYQPVIQEAMKRGSAIAANAKIMGSGEGYGFGLVLRMGTPEQCMAEIKPPQKGWFRR